MHDMAVGFTVFGCLLVASLGSRALYERLPKHHRVDETETVVRLFASLFVVMTSLMIGLMLNQAKNTLDAADKGVHAYATQLILFDRAMRHYGAEETAAARGSLLAYARQAAARMRQSDPVLSSKTAEMLLRDTVEAVQKLVPADADHAALKQELEKRFSAIYEMRWSLVEQSEGTVPAPLIVMVTLWLILIFASYGFRAPNNAFVATSFVVSSLLVACAVYLILDMDVPFDGLIQVSSVPLDRVVAELSR
jgi:hypothetical protein